jgi:hypothetical protein
MAAVEGRIARVSSQAASDYLGIPMRELKELRRRRKIPFYRIGHRTVSYDVADLDAFLTGCRVPAGGGVVGRGR